MGELFSLCQAVYIPSLYVSPRLVSVTALCSPCMFSLLNIELGDKHCLRVFVTFPLVDVNYINCCYLSELLMLGKQYTCVKMSSCPSQDSESLQT